VVEKHHIRGSFKRYARGTGWGLDGLIQSSSSTHPVPILYFIQYPSSTHPVPIQYPSSTHPVPSQPTKSRVSSPHPVPYPVLIQSLSFIQSPSSPTRLYRARSSFFSWGEGYTCTQLDCAEAAGSEIPGQLDCAEAAGSDYLSVMS